MAPFTILQHPFRRTINNHPIEAPRPVPYELEYYAFPCCTRHRPCHNPFINIAGTAAKQTSGYWDLEPLSPKSQPPYTRDLILMGCDETIWAERAYRERKEQQKRGEDPDAGPAFHRQFEEVERAMTCYRWSAFGPAGIAAANGPGALSATTSWAPAGPAYGAPAFAPPTAPAFTAPSAASNCFTTGQHHRGPATRPAAPPGRTPLNPARRRWWPTAKPTASPAIAPAIDKPLPEVPAVDEGAEADDEMWPALGSLGSGPVAKAKAGVGKGAEESAALLRQPVLHGLGYCQDRRTSSTLVEPPTAGLDGAWALRRAEEEEAEEKEEEEMNGGQGRAGAWKRAHPTGL